MNIENMNKLIGQLERLPDEKFDMMDYIQHNTPCGTTACIAGWCSLLNGGPQEKGVDACFYFAREFLDLSDAEAMHLFMGRWSPHPLKSQWEMVHPASRSEAIDHLRSLVAGAAA